MLNSESLTDEFSIGLEDASALNAGDHRPLRKHLHPLGKALKYEANGHFIMDFSLEQIVVQELVELNNLFFGDAQHLCVDVDVEDVGVHAEHLGDAVQVLPPQLQPLTPIHHHVEVGEDLLGGRVDLCRVILVVFCL